MNTAYLENFIAIAEEKNISAAARRMHIAQSALSTQLKTLEEEMGCVLLKRNPHGVSLSYEGELFYEYARRVLAMERELRERLDDCAEGATGVLRLGVSSACPGCWTARCTASAADSPRLNMKYMRNRGRKCLLLCGTEGWMLELLRRWPRLWRI